MVMKHIGTTLKTLRKEKGMTQRQIAELVNMHRSNYSKVESGERELSLEAISKIAQYFGLTVDELINFDNTVLQEVSVEDKALVEQIRLMQELEEEERAVIFKMIDTFLTQKKLKDFFKKNIATL